MREPTPDEVAAVSKEVLAEMARIAERMPPGLSNDHVIAITLATLLASERLARRQLEVRVAELEGKP